MSNNSSSGRKRLLVLTSTFPRWERDREPPFVYELSRRLAEEFDVWVLAPHAPGARLRENWNGMNVVRFRYFFTPLQVLAYRGGILSNLRRTPVCYLLVPLFLVAQLIALVRLVGREKIDVVHAHWLIPQGMVAVVGRWLLRRKFTLLCTSHGSDLLGLRGPLFAAVKRWVMRHSDALTVVSGAMEDHALALGAAPEKVSVLSMGMDATHLFVPDERGARSGDELLYVGRLTAQKGVEMLLRAMPRIIGERPGTTLTVVGQGPLEKELQAMSEELGISRQVRFLGGVENSRLPELYRRAALFVFPSLGEGFGLVCAEALACECPVIASDLPAVREIVREGETGILFPAADGHKMASQVLALLADQDLRRRLGKAGRKWVAQRYEWRSVAGAYGTLIKALAGGGGNAVEIKD